MLEPIRFALTMYRLTLLFGITTACKYFLCDTDVENLWIMLNTFFVKLLSPQH